MKVWAIKRPSDGFFMPEVSGRGGYTYTEPANLPPRLFRRAQDAKTALTYWLRGEVVYGQEGSSAWEGDVEYVYKTTNAVPGRLEQGLVVVCLNLVEVSE